MVALAISLLSDLHLATQPDAFRWQVSVVGTTGSSAIQERVETPTEPSPPPSAPVALSMSQPALIQKTWPVSRQAPIVAAPEPHLRNSTNRREQSVAEQTQLVPQDGTLPNVPLQITAPVQPLRPAPSQTATPAPSISSPPVHDGPSSSELFPPAAFSAPAEATAPSPSQNASAIARDTVDAPLAVVPPTRIPGTSSSTGASSSMSPPVQEARMGKPDLSWLTDSLRNKVQESQRYSTVARLNGLQGRVVLRITVKENGELLVAITTSSGHDVLDQDAVEQVKRLSPLPPSQPLGRAQQVLNLPIIYSLNQ